MLPVLSFLTSIVTSCSVSLIISMQPAPARVPFQQAEFRVMQAAAFSLAEAAAYLENLEYPAASRRFMCSSGDVIRYQLSLSTGVIFISGAITGTRTGVPLLKSPAAEKLAGEVILSERGA